MTIPISNGIMSYMREKNVRRAAHALYVSQADDKNAILSTFVKRSAPEAATLVEDQGRALVLLEKLVLPCGKDSYEEDEMAKLLLKKLKKKGHRIQADDEEDDEKYAAEKQKWEESRRARVPELLGKSLDTLDENTPERVEEQIIRLERRGKKKMDLRKRVRTAIIVLCQGQLP